MADTLTLIKDKETQKPSKTTCYHCGDLCQEEIISFEDKAFCCTGCKTVYQILAENNLCQYYELDQHPGVKLKRRNFGDKYAFLDNEQILTQLLSFADQNLQKITFSIPGIHCSSCIWLLENLYLLQEGIIESRVNFLKKEIHLSYHPQEISLRQLVELLTTLGYEPHISLKEGEKKQKNKKQNHLVYKIGITGFCFGNIMLLSFPEYLSLTDYPLENYQSFFGILNILLALPIFFYSSAAYFRSAFKALSAGSPNLDVPIALGILALFGRSLYEILMLNQAGYMDSLAGLLFFLLIGRWVQERTYEGLSFDRDYKSYFPLAVKAFTDQKTVVTKPVKELQKEDKIQIRNQELIPVDSILLSEQAFIDYSFVSGEAEPVEKNKGDYIYAGGRQVGQSITLEVKKEVSQSYLTQLWNHESFQKNNTNQTPDHITVISRYFTYVVIAIALFTGILWYFIQPEFVWLTISSVLIVACPCALALATPYALGNTMRIFGKHKFYLKNARVIAELAKISHVVFDKTGTITDAHELSISYQGQHLTTQEKIGIKSLASHSIHPLSQKIVKYLADYVQSTPQDFKEIHGNGITACMNGCRIMMGSATFTGTLEQNAKHMQSRVYISVDGVPKGYFLIQNRYRFGILDLIKKMSKKLRVSLISGDNDSEKAVLQPYFGENNLLKFRQKPEDKLNFIQNLQATGEQVAMIGDGLNDAGALQQAHVGITITEDSSSFSPACDAILDATALPQLEKFVHFAKISMQVVRISLLISLLYNLIGLGFAISGQLSPIIAAILMPLSSVTVVAFVVGATNLLAKWQRLL